MQLRTDTEGMKALGKKQVCDIILYDQRPKCQENQQILIKQLEKVCYQFMVQVAAEGKGVRMRHHGPSAEQCRDDFEID